MNVDLDAAVAALRRLDERGLNRGATGNLSLRGPLGGRAGFWITPTGIGAAIAAADFVWLADDDAEAAARDDTGDARPPSVGRWRPSSEWALHHAAYRARPAFGAVVHVHAPASTALACLQRPLPAFHYMVAVAGGDDVPLVPYHLFGTPALGRAVGEALRHRSACLLANHGLVAAGSTLAEAVSTAVEVEALCGIYLQALSVGTPVLLGADDMARVKAKFASYGQPAPDTAHP